MGNFSKWMENIRWLECKFWKWKVYLKWKFYKWTNSRLVIAKHINQLDDQLIEIIQSGGQREKDWRKIKMHSAAFGRISYGIIYV